MNSRLRSCIPAARKLDPQPSSLAREEIAGVGKAVERIARASVDETLYRLLDGVERPTFESQPYAPLGPAPLELKWLAESTLSTNVSSANLRCGKAWLL